MEEAQWRSEDVGWDPARMVVTCKDAEDQTHRKRRRRFKGESCQVPFCSNPLELQYHKKYHVCREHFAAPCVALEGVNSRFCQKCGKFHCVDAFDAEKRTCRVALAQHNARRRKRDKAAGGDSRHAAVAGGGASSSGGTGSAGAAPIGAARNDGGGAASGPSGSGGTVLLPPLDAAASQPGTLPAAPDGVPPTKLQQVVQHPLRRPAQAGQPGSHSQPASQQTEEQQPCRLVHAQAAAPPGQPLAAAVPVKLAGEPATLAAQREAAALSWHDAPAARVAPAGAVPPPAPHCSEAAPPPLCAANLQGSGSAGSSGAPLPAQSPGQPAAWLARQGRDGGLLLPGGPSPASLPTSDLFMLTSGSSGSMELLPPEALLLRPAYNQASAQASGQGPTPAGSAAPRIEGHLFSMGSLGELPGSCFAEPHGWPCLQPPAGHTEQQLQQQQYQGQQQQPQRPEGTAEFARHLGGWAAASTNLPPEFQARPEAQPAPAALEPRLHGVPEGLAERQALPAAPMPAAAGSYTSPASLRRISLKIFQCTPDQLAPSIRDELESVLGVAPAVLESYIRPGCTHLTVDLRLPPQQAAAVAAAHADAAALLQALRVPAALGAAAGSAAVLQWLGRLATAAAGERSAETVPAAPPRLAVRPACIAVPPPGQPWPLVELRLQPPQGAGWDLARATVLARQSGRHLAVAMWGSDSRGAQAALQAARAGAPPAGLPASPSATPDESPRGGARGASGGGWPGSAHRSPGAFSGEDDADSAFEEAAAADASPACLPGSTGVGPAGLWVCPVGLQPGCCEVEVELRGATVLPAGAAGAAGALPLLSRAAPLLALRDAAAAAEVQGLVCASGLEGREQVDSLMRDIGLAAAYLEGVQGQGAAPAPASRPPLPPALVAAAAAAAAAYAEQHDMPAVERLLRRAHSAAAAAAGGAQPAAGGEASAAGGPPGACAAPAGRVPGADPSHSADDGLSTLAGGPGAAGEKAAEPVGHQTGTPAGKLGMAGGSCWELELAGAGKAPGKGSALGGSGDGGLDYDALKVQAIMQDIEGLVAGVSPAGGAASSAARPPGCPASGTSLGLSTQVLLRLGAGLAAFFFAVLLARLLPVAG